MAKCDIKLYGIHKRDENILKCKEQLKLRDCDIVYDEPPSGWPYYTAKKTWLLPFDSDDITHRCVLQDDCQPCDDFQEQINAICTAHPDCIVSLCALDYHEKNPDIDALKTPYVYMKHVIGGCSLIIPRQYIQDCFDWQDKNFPKIGTGDPHEDAAIAFYGISHNIKIITTIPCTIQHIGDVSSLFGTTVPIQRSAYFQQDCSGVDWKNRRISQPK